MRSRIPYPFLLFLLGLIGCGNPVIFDETIQVENGIWSYDQVLPFEFMVTDTSILYEIQLDVDHSVEYPYQNLYVQIKTTFPNQDIKEDIVSLELANKNGLWQGDCNQSECHVSIPLQAKTYFQEPGKYAISFAQHLRQDSIPGIQALGLSVMKLPE